MGQGYIPTYWEVVRVYNFQEEEIEDSGYEGVPISVQTGGSMYTGFNAYVNFANWGNSILDNTGQMTDNGEYIYAQPNYNMYGGSSKQSYLLMGGNRIVYAFAAIDMIFVAKPCSYQTFMDKSAEMYQKMNPYPDSNDRSFDDSQSRSQSSSSKRVCSFCNGTGLNPACDYAPDYGGPETTYYCETCKAYKRAHSHGRCPSCLGKGYN